MTELRWLRAGESDTVLAAAHLFDHPPTREWAEEFLSRAGHHLCVTYVDGRAAGFVTGVEMVHPDKGTECSSTNSAWMRRSGAGASVGRW